MMTNDKHLPCIEIGPNDDACCSIIWLHGLGADGSDFVPAVTELNLPESLGVRFLFPSAPIMPVTINNGYKMRAWYDISALSIEGISDRIGIRQSVKEIEALIEKEIKRGVPANRIVLAGFSQGSVIALITGLGYSKTLGGILALSGYLPLATEVLQKEGHPNHNIPIFLAHGMQDPVVPYVLGKAAFMALEQAGYQVAWHSYPIQHTVCPQEVIDVRNWLLEVLRK